MIQVVFNLQHYNDLLYLPAALLVETDAQGRLGYMQQRATAATIVPYGIEMTPELSDMFDLIEILTPKNLEAKFKPPKAKSAVALPHLLTDPATKPFVEKFIFDKIDKFLSEIAGNRWPLTLDLERKTPACDMQVSFPEQEIMPHISFLKKEDGVEYRFRLGPEDTPWTIRSKEVLPLTNTDPAWLLVGYDLYRVPGINGNMVKPFRTKDVVQIPSDKAKVYFRQFVAKSAGRTRIEAEGFEVHITRDLMSARLAPTENILEKTWYLQAFFTYRGAEFSHGEKRDIVTAVDYAGDGSDDILIRQVIRNPEAEQEKVRALTGLGLQTSGKLFSTGQELSLEMLVNWLARNSAALLSAGIKPECPVVEGKPVALLNGQLHITTSATDDWFDLRGHVQAGEFSFPFRSLWAHLRARDRFFRLPDGTCFLIPEEWFTRYGEIADAAREGTDDGVRLPRALFTLLEAAGVESGVGESVQTSSGDSNYTVSPELRAELRPYQLQGVKWLAGHYNDGFGACLADDMGLGKTLQTIAFLLYAKEQKNKSAQGAANAQLDLFLNHTGSEPLAALVVLPASLIFNWRIELSKFAPSLFVCSHTGPKRGKDARALASHDIVLTTYHTVRQDLELLSKIRWHVIVLDESQMIKNRTSEVAKGVLSLEADNKISLSGTPIENSLSDLWSQMEFINPATLGSFTEFRDQFITPIEKRNDSIAKERLFKRVRPFFLRRTKQEVAPDLPALSEQLFYTEMTDAQRKLYEKTKSAARNEILALFDDPKTRFQALQALTRLRQLANDPRLVETEYTGGSGKFDDVMAQWDVIRRSNHKVLFFSSFERHLQLFRSAFEEAGFAYAWLTGDTSQADRAKAVERFQQDDTVQAFFMTVKAGGVGLNLTAADYVFLLDPWWNPAVEDQAIARAHRIGQQNPVTAIRFLSRDTIEDKIRQLQERKKKLGEGLFTDESPQLSREEFESLLM